MGVGARGRALEISRRSDFTPPFTNPDAGEPSEFDQEAYDHWAALFRRRISIRRFTSVNGNKTDNFWMMGDTGPCGPCSELHVDLTPDGDTRGALVNKDDPRCIEIWNLVFIQFNANADGSFAPLPQRHVDTGMGFERTTAIIQGTKNLTEFSGTVSNYETDIFRPIFDEMEKLSGKKYESTLPKHGTAGESDQEKIDIAFRVIADHIRALLVSRSPTESFLQTKGAVTFCVGSCVARFATAARSASTNRSSSNLSTSSQKQWAMFFPKSARNRRRSRKQFAAKKRHLIRHWIARTGTIGQSDYRLQCSNDAIGNPFNLERSDGLSATAAI